MKNLHEWQSKAKEYMMVGSRVTCNPPPTDTDEDWIVLDLDHHTADELERELWGDCGDDYDDDEDTTKDMTVFRNEHVNVLCMHSADQYYKFKLATKIAKYLNLMKKGDRVMLFEAIRYGRDAVPMGVK